MSSDAGGDHRTRRNGPAGRDRGGRVLLLIACINVTNLLLARARAAAAMAIRAAVGGRDAAGCSGHSLTESLLLSILGGAAGLAVAWWTVQVLVAETPPILSGVGLDRAARSPVLAFTVVACVVTGLVAGALPTCGLPATRQDDPLREGGRSPIGPPPRAVRAHRRQVALTPVLMLFGAELMLRSFISRPRPARRPRHGKSAASISRSRFALP